MLAIDRSGQQPPPFKYDPFGNQIETTLTAGSLSTPTSADFDDQGRRDAETDAMGLTKSFAYNDRGQLTAVELPAVADPDNAGQLMWPRYEDGYDLQRNPDARRPFRVELRTMSVDNGRGLDFRPLQLGADRRNPLSRESLPTRPNRRRSEQDVKVDSLRSFSTSFEPSCTTRGQSTIQIPTGKTCAQFNSTNT